MSKIFIISNTNFNISKNLNIKEWLKNIYNYYYNEFIPYLKNNVSSNDILIHLGNFLHTTKPVDLNVLNFIQKLFENISDILPIYIIEGENDSLSLNILKNFKNIEIVKKPTIVEILVDQRFTLIPFNSDIDNLDIDKNSDFCFFNINYLNSPKKDIFIKKINHFKKCYNGYYDKNSVTNNIKNLGSPYNIEDDSKKGFIVLETHANKDKFILNKTSPKFKTININNEENLNSIPKDSLKNNYVKLNINKKLILDNKLKIDMLISEYDIKNISYIDDDIIKDKEDILDLNESSLSINDMIVNYIINSDFENKDTILKEFKNLIELNKK